MGSHFFTKAPKFSAPSGANLEARAAGAAGYASRSAGGAAQKDIGAAQGIYKAGGLKPDRRDAATAPGPKKV